MIKWGIIGCGNIAKMFISSIRNNTEGKVIACASKDYQRAKFFAQEYIIEQPYGSYAELLANPGIDAVYIATTHDSHYAVVKASLAAGKHVLCEKPITVNALQAKQVYQLAEHKHCLLLEAVWTRFLPAIIAMQRMLSEGAIGEVINLNATFAITGDFSPTHRLRSPHLAGGSLLDLGIYPITMAALVFNRQPSHIKSSACIGETGVDDRMYMLFDYPNGKNATLCSSFSHHHPTEAIIGGTEGYIRVPDFLGAKGFSVHQDNGACEEYQYPFSEGHNFTFEIAEFQRCVLLGLSESKVLPAKESIAVMETMDTLRDQCKLKYPAAIEQAD